MKEKGRTRVKDFSKGTGFIRDEHKFPENMELKDEINFLNNEESNNLQDMINFAASRSDPYSQTIYPIESLYSINIDVNIRSSIER